MHDDPTTMPGTTMPGGHGAAPGTEGTTSASPATRGRHPAATAGRRPRGPAIERLADDEGSLVTEYGLLAVVGATAASLVVKWASGGAIFELFAALTKKVRVMLGA